MNSPRACFQILVATGALFTWFTFLGARLFLTFSTLKKGRIIFSIVDGLVTFVRTNIFAKKPDQQCDGSVAATGNDDRTNSEANSEANSPDDTSEAEFGKLNPSLEGEVIKYCPGPRPDPLEEEMTGEYRSPCLCPF